MKYIALIISLLILAFGAGLWLVGVFSKNKKIKSYGITVLGIWLVLDLILLIIAYPLGWYAN